MKKVLVVLALMVAAVTTTVAQMHGIGTVQGKVVDDTNAPVTDVKVTATLSEGGTPITSTSDGKGEWKVAGMTRGNWDVVFEKTGFAPSRAKVFLESEQTRLWPITIKMTPAPTGK